MIFIKFKFIKYFHKKIKDNKFFKFFKKSFTISISPIIIIIMVYKNLTPQNKDLLKSKENIIISHNESIIESSNEDSTEKISYLDLILTSNYDSLQSISRKYPASLILYSNNDESVKLPENAFYILPYLNENSEIHLNNIIKLAKKIKEAYFRKVILILENQDNIYTISKYLKKIGFYLEIYDKKRFENLFNNFAYLKNKKSGQIYFENNFKGIFIRKKNKIFFFESRWHKNSNLHDKLIIELKHGILKSKYFLSDTKNNSQINIEVKEKFLGDHIGEGFFVTDTDGKLIYFNKIFYKMFSIGNINLKGKFINEIIHSTSTEIIFFLNYNAREPVSITVDSNFLGLNRTYSITYSPIIENEKIVNICGIIRDVTLQKRMENEIKLSQLNSENINKRLVSIQHTIIFGFSKLSEFKDKETGAHLERIQNYVKILAFELLKKELFVDYKTKKNYLSEQYIEEIALSSLLHDIGKVGIPDNILLKPGRLTKDEYQYMQLHTKIGGDTLTYLDDIVGELSFLALAKEIAYYHHERWNGKGYPFGLKHDEIPLSARIVSICDVYDALTTKRPYKSPYSHEKTCEIIYDHSGLLFDPIITSVFSSVENNFKTIRKKFAD